ncbi:methyltransferase domain protein [Ceratobasidium sp. AG-Ba]|nr:methyltransferase domain protein [Ceratobasidium sp. AG-Ba]
MATRIWNEATEGVVWVVDPAADAREYDTDSSYVSDTDSSIDSMTTIQSNDVSTFFRYENGRAYPSYEGVPMVLPADQGEIRRLRIQHLAVKLVVGNPLDELIAKHLASCPEERRKSVLDVRTQTGLWAEEIAARYPDIYVKSIDVAPTIQHIPRDNLHYELYDVHKGITENDGTFDIIHARHSLGMFHLSSIEWADQVKDWRALLRDMHRVLRPGGLFIFAEIYPRITLPDELTPALDGPCAQTARLFEQIRDLWSKGGIQTEGSQLIDAWLSPGDILWTSRPNFGFHRATHGVWELPVNGLWHPDPAMQEVGLLMAMNVCQFVENTRPVFLASGMTDLEFDEWFDEIGKEIRDPMNNAVVRYHIVSAYKL